MEQSSVLRSKVLLIFGVSFLFLSNFTFSNAYADSDKDPKACASLLTEAIPTSWIEKMAREEAKADPSTSRLRDVVQRLGFSNVALNRELLLSHNENYTTTLADSVITNQKQSGRCWIFAGLNMVRTTLIADGKVPADFEFSENYLHFFNMLEKSNRYLERVIEKTSKHALIDKHAMKTLRSTLEPNIGDGGWFEHFLFLVSKYGMVPKEVMPDTKSAESTAVLLNELKKHLASTSIELLAEYQRATSALKGATESSGSAEEHKQLILDRLRKVKEKGLVGTWKILATHLGTPPTEFNFRTQTPKKKDGRVWMSPAKIERYTPKEFSEKFVGFDVHDYVVVSNYPRRPVGHVFELKKSGIGNPETGTKPFDLRFMNLTMDRMEELAVTAISNGQPVWFAADVSKDVDSATGIMHPKVFDRNAVYNLSEAEKMVELNRSHKAFFGISSPNHAMLLTGLDRPDPKGPVVKFRNENSWGRDVGSRGVYHLYREWFRENVFQIIVHRKYLNDAEKQLWDSQGFEISRDEELTGRGGSSR